MVERKPFDVKSAPTFSWNSVMLSSIVVPTFNRLLAEGGVIAFDNCSIQTWLRCSPSSATTSGARWRNLTFYLIGRTKERVSAISLAGFWVALN
jgi:hypothetical protein